MALELLFITGMSGSGKSVALHALEDAGYYCVDNLPPELLDPFVALEHAHHGNRLAIAMDVRSVNALSQVPQQLQRLRGRACGCRACFSTPPPTHWCAASPKPARRHPLSKDELREGQLALVQTIERERELLAELREQSHVIDTSAIRSSQLQSYVKNLTNAPPGRLTLVFQSFAFKRGVRVDADYVFDVRMLPNPHYEPHLRELTGRDQPVIDYLQQQPRWMHAHAHRRLPGPLAAGAGTEPPQLRDGGHRLHGRAAPLGLLVEQLARQFSVDWTTLRRHREMDAR